MGLTECSWCHTLVEKPCATIRECKTCSTPYTLTAEQSARFHESVRERQPLSATPLPIEEG